MSDEKKESGIDPEMTDIEHALEELIEIENAAETDQAVVNEQKNRKINQDRGNAEDIRKTAMEKLGQTKKRKAEDGEGKKVETKVNRQRNVELSSRKKMCASKKCEEKK